jgi:dipeptidyl aminopeptidase/acylaminoacyl peptidase
MQFNHEWGGRPWDEEARELLEKYNPINYVHKWSTPQLVIHGSKDACQRLMELAHSTH